MKIDNISPYASVAAKIIDQGYSALPVAPNTKVPGKFGRGSWRFLYDWPRFCSRLPTQMELDIWCRWPNAGICVALGFNGVCVVDIDTANWDVVDAIENVTGLSPLQKRGVKGHSHFFRAPLTATSTSFRISGQTVLDLLCFGRQTVIPPTLYPDLGRPYQWLQRETLEHIAPDSLPELSGDIIDRLSVALKPFGWRPERPNSCTRTVHGGRTFESNKVALANVDAWAPFLGVPYKRGPKGYRIVATWRGGKNGSVGIDPRGIRDFKADEGLSAVDLVMRALGVKDAEADRWLRERLGMNPKSVRFASKVSA